uniref:Uncharacterized protein n=1 Tax=Solanum tuberosum TaxID=4113 RepID=M1DAE5_SOLTU
MRHMMIYDVEVFAGECYDAEVFDGSEPGPVWFSSSHDRLGLLKDLRVFSSVTCTRDNQMPRTRASVSSYRGEAVPKDVIETPIRGRGRARARVHARGVTLVRGRAHGAVPARGKAREASPEPPVEVGEDQVPPKFGAPSFYETVLRMLGGQPLVGPAAAVGALIASVVILTAAN